MTSKCAYCTTLLCKGCKEKYKPFFTGYKPQYYFKTTNTDVTISLPTRSDKDV